MNPPKRQVVGRHKSTLDPRTGTCRTVRIFVTPAGLCIVTPHSMVQRCYPHQPRNINIMGADANETLDLRTSATKGGLQASRSVSNHTDDKAQSMRTNDPVMKQFQKGVAISVWQNSGDGSDSNSNWARHTKTRWPFRKLGVNAIRGVYNIDKNTDFWNRWVMIRWPVRKLWSVLVTACVIHNNPTNKQAVCPVVGMCTVKFPAELWWCRIAPVEYSGTGYQYIVKNKRWHQMWILAKSEVTGAQTSERGIRRTPVSNKTALCWPGENIMLCYVMSYVVFGTVSSWERPLLSTPPSTSVLPNT